MVDLFNSSRIIRPALCGFKIFFWKTIILSLVSQYNYNNCVDRSKRYHVTVRHVDMTPIISKSRLIWLFVALLCVIPIWMVIQTQQGYSYDDAFITLTYARSLAEGKGFVYNGGPEYLGTTTPLLTLVLAALQRTFPAGDIHEIASWFGALMWAMSVALAFVLGKRVIGQLTGLICAILVVTTPFFLYVRTAEFPLLIALSLCGIYLSVLGRYWGAGIVLGLAYLTRGDAALLAGLIGLIILLQDRKVPWGLGFGFLIAILPWSIYSFLTFGSPLPATLGIKRVHRAMNVWPHIAVGFWQWFSKTNVWFRARLITTAAISGIALVYYIWRRNLWAAVIIIWGILYVLAYLILNVPFYFWYTSVIFVSMALGAGLAIGSLLQDEHLTSRIQKVAGMNNLSKAVALILLLALISMGFRGFSNARKYLVADADAKKQAYIQVANWLEENTPSYSTVGFIEVGWMGFYSKRQIIDLLGLVTPGTESYLLERDHAGLLEAVLPDYYVRNEQFDGWGMNRDIHESYSFASRYESVFQVSQRNARPVTVYRKMDDTPMQELPVENDLVGRVELLPGEHLSVSPMPQTGYRTVDQAEIRMLHETGADIWLHIPQGQSSEELHMLMNWLRKEGVLKLQTKDQDVFWLAGDPKLDRFDLLQNNGLLTFLQGDQLRLVYREHGDHRRRDQEYSDAIYAYEQALAIPLGQEDPHAMLGLAAALLGKGQHLEALPHLERSAELLPDNYWAHRLLGNTYTHLGRHIEAVEEYQRALEIRSDDAKLLLDLAQAQNRLGNKTEALQSLDQLNNREDGNAYETEIQTLRQSLQE